MGSCCMPKSGGVYHFETNTITNKYHKTSQSFEEKENEEEFDDMPEIEPEKYKGYGIKRMKAYKCDLNIDDLNQIREAFWHSKINENPRWHFIRQACLYDNSKSEEYLTQHGFRVVNGCINQCTDHTKFIYKIPNYCVNDPYFEKELVSMEKKEKYQKDLEVIVSDSCDNKTKICVNEGMLGKELKEVYMKASNKDSQTCSVRMFFGGNEIRDEHCLFQHKIKNGYHILVLISTNSLPR